MTGQCHYITKNYTSAAYIKAEEEARVPFVCHQIVTSNCDGLEYTFHHHDITIHIPPGAVPVGEEIQLEMAITMYGPFYFPGNSRPVSPILWLCVLNEDTVLIKPFKVIFPHFLIKLTEDKVSYHEVGFAKASHNNYSFKNNQISYHFLSSEEEFQFSSKGCEGYGILQTKHCCFYCIQAKKSLQLTLDTRYCLAQIETQSLYVPKFDVYFVAGFLLRTCLKVINTIIN